jgi:poly(ADP-ribose) glycohydrolase ARH3
MASPAMEDRFSGCLVGHALGDALGAPFEGMPSDVVYREFGPIRQALDRFPLAVLSYTDDTEMSIAVAQTLVDDGAIDPARLAAQFERHYNPARGYGPGAQRILETMREGGDWETLAAGLFPGGSLGNGAAMRVAPVAMLFYRDRMQMVEQARLSALPTHRHPVGIEGAQVLALAIADALNHEDFNHDRLFTTLRENVVSDEMSYALKIASRLAPDDSLWTLGNALEAHRSVPTSIVCFARNPDSFLDAISTAISLGGDTDTLAAMTGAISGARLGISGTPEHLVVRLENGEKGLDHIVSLARRLSSRFI